MPCWAFPRCRLPDGGDETTGSELVYNGDFSVYTESALLPAGWELTAYQSGADSVTASFGEDEDGVRIVSLTNEVPNDARLIQTISVQPSTIYRLRAEIRTSDVQYGTGANLSIDNYPIDGTYCYSENLFGSDAWRTVSLYFLTAPEQTSVNVRPAARRLRHNRRRHGRVSKRIDACLHGYRCCRRQS